MESYGLTWDDRRQPELAGFDVNPQSINLDAYAPRVREVELMVLEPWAWMEAQSILTRTERAQGHCGNCGLSLRGAQFYADRDPTTLLAASRISKDDLHRALHGDALEIFWRRSYDLSIFAAMKAVEIAVREASRLSDSDLGVALMRKAFDKKDGPLMDLSLVEGERESVAHLFAGAIGTFKSPNSHRYVAYDADTCADLLVFASRLLRMVDKTVEQKFSGLALVRISVGVE